MGGRRKSHEKGYKKRSRCLESRIKGRINQSEGKVGGGQ